MTFQWILFVINLCLAIFEVVLSIRNKHKERELKKRESAINSSFDNHTSTGKNRHDPESRAVLKLDLDDIDIDRVKDAYTRNYLAKRKLINNISLN